MIEIETNQEEQQANIEAAVRLLVEMHNNIHDQAAAQELMHATIGFVQEVIALQLRLVEIERAAIESGGMN